MSNSRRVRSSQRCHDFLHENRLIDHYPRWEVKKDGCMIGLTLFGKTKTGNAKIVYAKCYQQLDSEDPFHRRSLIDSLQDYAIFTVLGRCGASVPKVKLKGAKEKVFIFARDIVDQVSSPGHQFEFHLLSSGFEASKLDKVSAAKLLMLSVVFNVFDMHEDNMGYLVSKDGGVSLAMIDFTVVLNAIRFRNDESLDTNILLELVRREASDKVIDVARIISERDYLFAFRELETGFEDAINEIVQSIQGMKFESDERKQLFAEKLDIWKSNFSSLQKFVRDVECSYASVKLRG